MDYTTNVNMIFKSKIKVNIVVHPLFIIFLKYNINLNKYVFSLGSYMFVFFLNRFEGVFFIIIFFVHIFTFYTTYLP